IHGRGIALDEFGNRLGEPGGPGLRLVGELVLVGGGCFCHDGRNYRASRLRRRRAGGRRDLLDNSGQAMRRSTGVAMEWERLVVRLGEYVPTQAWAQMLVGVGALVLAALVAQWVGARIVLSCAHRLLVLTGREDW